MSDAEATVFTIAGVFPGNTVAPSASKKKTLGAKQTTDEILLENLVMSDRCRSVRVSFFFFFCRLGYVSLAFLNLG